MVRQTVDNSELQRWRSMDASTLLPLLADHVKPDREFSPRTSLASTRWHVLASGRDFEILCTHAKFLDTRRGIGGAGAIDLAMHLLALDFLRAVQVLRERGV